jgi:ketosteroid isomerase-like protein
MSQENLAAIQRGFEAFNRRDTEALLKELHTEVAWCPVFQVMLGGEATVYRGHEGVRDAFREWYDTLAEIHAEVSEIRNLGEQIVALGHIRARGQGSGAEVDSPAGWVAEFKDGKAVRVREYLDPQQALEAAGLEE